MPRFLAVFSAGALLTAVAHAQCLAPASGSSILGPGFVKWDATNGFASTYDVDDEGLSSPPIALTAFASFPMAGAAGNLDRLWVNSNGTIYLTDSSLALTQPVGASLFGTDSLAEMRGSVAGGSARIVPFGDDLEMSAVLGAVWDVRVDQTVPGQVRVIWTDVARFANTTDRFAFDCTLFSNGAVKYSYSSTIVADFRYVGISIGNLVGSTTSPSRDLTNFADSGTEGMLYESFTTSFDLAGREVTLLPNGLGGYTSLVTCAPAFHAAYGSGCYNAADSFHDFMATPAIASPKLQGNAMILQPTAVGYTASWVPGGAGAYVAPTGAATTVFATATDDGAIAVTPSVPLPVPGGSAAALNVQSNGFVSIGATPAITGLAFTPTSATFATATIPAFFSWHDFNESEAGSGRIKREEIGSVLYITWEGVESYADPDTTLNPSTQQIQFDLATGTVTMEWPSISPDSTETTYAAATAYLVGYGGVSTTAPAPIGLDVGLPVFTAPNGSIQPLTLAASPAPVYVPGNPTAPITFTVTNAIDLAPPAGFGITFLLFSVAPLPGVDLGFLGMPGCKLNIASLDVTLNMPSTAPTTSLTFPIPQPLSPGLSFYSQALSLFPPNSLPIGQNSFGGLLSNGVQSYFNTF